MKTIDEIESVFDAKKDNPEPLRKDPPLFTFYRIGPCYMSYKYPVDTKVIKEEILNPNGIIGPSYYKKYDRYDLPITVPKYLPINRDYTISEDNRSYLG